MTTDGQGLTDEIPCAFIPGEIKKRLDPFERTDLWRRAQEQLKQPHLKMLKRLFAEHHHDSRLVSDLTASNKELAAQVAVLLEAVKSTCLYVIYDQWDDFGCRHCGRKWRTEPISGPNGYESGEKIEHSPDCITVNVAGAAAALLKEREWRPIDKVADAETWGWLYSPPENLYTDSRRKDPRCFDIRFGKPRHFTWATMIIPVAEPAPPKETA